MKSWLRLLLICALWVSSSAAWAQAKDESAAQPYTPEVGQAGKDVIWVPTPEATVKGMLELAKVGPKDFVVDLGSGDGRTVIAAARDFGARALGVEYNPKMVEVARRAAAAAGVAYRAQFRRGDIFAADFSRATVLTLYLLPDLNLKLRPTILRMKPGTRVVSHSFNMGEWEPDQTAEADARTILLWLVPARAAGTWRVRHPDGSFDLRLSQSFQKLQGSARSGSTSLEVKEARLSGDAISFVIVAADGSGSDYTGRLSGPSMQGTVKASGKSEAKWTAARQQPKTERKPGAKQQ